MVVISGVFGEAEIRAMSKETLLLLGRLLDDKLAFQIKEYLENPEADKDVVNKIVDTIGERVDRSTFHMKVLDMGIMDTLMKLSLPTLAFGEEDYDKIETQFSFLKENKNKLKSVIEPRESRDYREFLKQIKSLSTNMIGKPKEFDNLAERLQANKNAFCSANEKSRATGIYAAVARSRDWEIALDGVRYLKLCKEHDVEDWMRREF